MIIITKKIVISISSKKLQNKLIGVVINVVDDVSHGTPSFEKRTPLKCGFGKCTKKDNILS